MIIGGLHEGIPLHLVGTFFLSNVKPTRFYCHYDTVKSGKKIYLTNQGAAISRGYKQTIRELLVAVLLRQTLRISIVGLQI